MSETLTYDQINEQRSSAYMNRSNADPSVLLKRTDGRITTGRLMAGINRVYFSENGQDFSKAVKREAISDQYQQQLAEDLAGAALRSEVKISDGREEFPGMFDPHFESNADDAAINSSSELDNDDIALLERGLRSAREEIAKAQKEGRGDDSRYWQEIAGRYVNDLRNAGQTI
jgi:hypothetical protein